MRQLVTDLLEFVSTREADRADGGRVLPGVIAENCTGCALCAKACGSFVLEIHNGKASVVHGDRCVQCGHCVAVCPVDALEDRYAGAEDTPVFDPGRLPSDKSLFTFFRSRRSVRHYRRKPVSRKHLDRILDAGRYAPTAGNRQEVYHIVLTDQKEIQELCDMVFTSVLKMFKKFEKRAFFTLMSFLLGPANAKSLKNYVPLLELFHEKWERHGDDRIFYHAPAIILTHGPRWDDTVSFSCVAVLYQASLMAQSLNVGCCFNGFLQVASNTDGKIKKWLGIPSRHKCYGAMTLGYPKMKYRRLVRRDPPKVTWR
ncbi:MAG: nitroreductase family protein [Deltaproteobacteria bacterium]|nr:nitroreductase family protein [Deltaproteobacteria bacterium]